MKHNQFINESKKTTLKEYQDFILPFITILACLATLMVTMFTACSKSHTTAWKQSLLFPVSYNANECPYPPGCDAFIEEVVTNNFLSNDKSITVKTIGNRVAISTNRPDYYQSLSKIEILKDKANFVQK